MTRMFYLAALAALTSAPAHAGEAVTLMIGDEVVEANALAIYPEGVKAEAFTSASLSVDGLSGFIIIDVISDLRTKPVGVSTVPTEGTKLAECDTGLCGNFDGSGVRSVPHSPVDNYGLLIETNEADFDDTVRAVGSGTAIVGGVDQAYGSTTLEGDREALHISADFSEFGVDQCRVVAAMDGQPLVEVARACSDIGYVIGDGESYRHFLTDYHEYDYGYIWTWGFTVVDWYDIRFTW